MPELRYVNSICAIDLVRYFRLIALLLLLLPLVIAVRLLPITDWCVAVVVGCYGAHHLQSRFHHALFCSVYWCVCCRYHRFTRRLRTTPHGTRYRHVADYAAAYLVRWSRLPSVDYAGWVLNFEHRRRVWNFLIHHVAPPRFVASYVDRCCHTVRCRCYHDFTPRSGHVSPAFGPPRWVFCRYVVPDYVDCRPWCTVGVLPCFTIVGVCVDTLPLVLMLRCYDVTYTRWSLRSAFYALFVDPLYAFGIVPLLGTCGYTVSVYLICCCYVVCVLLRVDCCYLLFYLLFVVVIWCLFVDLHWYRTLRCFDVVGICWHCCCYHLLCCYLMFIVVGILLLIFIDVVVIVYIPYILIFWHCYDDDIWLCYYCVTLHCCVLLLFCYICWYFDVYSVFVILLMLTFTYDIWYFIYCYCY